MTTVIVHADNLDCRAAAVVKSNAEGEVEIYEVKIGEPFPLSAGQIADAEVWALGISTSVIEYWLDFEKCHVINADAGTAHLIDKKKHPWFTHGMEFAEVCDACDGAGYLYDDEETGEPLPVSDMCRMCNGTGGKFKRGRSVCVATWLSLYCKDGDDQPNYRVPDLLLTIEDDAMGYGNVPDSKAICLAMMVDNQNIEGFIHLLRSKHRKDTLEWLQVRGENMLDYRRHLAERFGPGLLAIMNPDNDPQDVIERVTDELPELIDALGITTKPKGGGEKV